MVDDGSHLLDTSLSLDGLALRTRELTLGAQDSRAMTQAFQGSISGGRQFDDVLKSLALRLSDMSVRLAFKPVTNALASGLNTMLSGLTGLGGAATGGGVTPFAAGGVIGAPSYFPLQSGGIGLAGEAGPEAIMPLARGPDGRLGVMGGAGGAIVNVHIATPDAESFRRSESYVTGQIARAVARGRRGL